MAYLHNHPAGNPVLKPGVYDAVVGGITNDRYRDDTKIYVRILLHLPGPGKNILTNIYLDDAPVLQRSGQRLWHFCKTVGLEPVDVFESPEEFEGRQLRVELYTSQPHESGQDRRYSDVKLFLPSEPAGDHGDGASDVETVFA